MIETRKARRREIFGWCMFDFANQAYTLLIITVIFGDLYTRIVVGDAPDYRLGNLLWSLALCLSYLLVVLSAPLLGAIMDQARAKKRILFASYLLTVASTALLYYVAPGQVWLGFALIVSNTAYSAGESFIASFLPFLGERHELGRISGLGWALGYAGGLLSAGFVLVFPGRVSAENFERMRWVGPLLRLFSWWRRFRPSSGCANRRSANASACGWMSCASPTGAWCTRCARWPTFRIWPGCSCRSCSRWRACT